MNIFDKLLLKYAVTAKELKRVHIQIKEIKDWTKIDSMNNFELIVSQSIKHLIPQRVNEFVFQFCVVKYLHKSQSGHVAEDSISLLPTSSDY